jgi:thioredoxin-related protein
MDTVTYPHETVQNELGSWVERKVDVTEWREVASLFEVTAVPIAVLVSADGTVLGRISNFVQPKEFADALSNARAEK